MPGVNGNYAHHQGHDQQQQNNGVYVQNGTTPAQQAPFSQTPVAGQTTDISKDEVGWYFVEQYYTTLSTGPQKLFLFYNKRSQFVSGVEMDKVPVCIGQRAIADRISELQFQDCKVRVTNVDSQASDSNIVIQVIGEISNKQQAHRKFTQTFVLATQTNGYFVLNDIFRYLIEEEEEAQPDDEQDVAPKVEEVQQAPPAQTVVQESAPAAADVPEPKVLTSSVDPIAVERDATVVDRELEEKVLKEQPKTEDIAPSVNGTAAGEPSEDEEDLTQATESEEPVASEEVPAATAESPEKPREPEHTPAPSPPKPATAQPAAPAKPAGPRSWASLAASANRVAIPSPSSSATQQQQQQQRAAPSKTSTSATTEPSVTSGSAAAAPAAPAAPAVQRDQSPAAASQDEWTAVGGNHNRQQSRQTIPPQPQEIPQVRAYIKNVREEMDAGLLKAYLEQFGEVTHFDIARQKVGQPYQTVQNMTDSPQNCAFVDFKTPEQYRAALAANPHTLEAEKFYIEERRPRPGNTFVPRGQFQGGRGGRGGPNQGGVPRGNMQGGARGNYAPRARGGPAGSRGRGGAAQAA